MISLSRSVKTLRLTIGLMLTCGPVSTAYSFEIGVNTHLRWYSMEQDHYLEMINNYGFNSFRDDYLWDMVEKKNGDYQPVGKLNRVESALSESKQRYGMNPIAVLAYGNDLYDKSGYPSNDAAITAYANYAYWTAKRFKGKVKYYEIWNEWNVGTGTHNKSPAPPPADVYFKLIKQASIAIKRADPQAIVIAGSFNPLVKDGMQWSDSLLDLGMLNYVDGISIHPYSYKSSNPSLTTPDGNLKKIDEYQAELNKKLGKEIPIYITEIGVPTNTGKFGYNQNYVAQYIVKYTMLAKARKYIKGVWWYDLSDDGDDPKNIEHRFGLLQKDGAKKPSIESYQKIADLIKNYSVKNYTVSTDGQVSITFSNEKKEAVASWKQSERILSSEEKGISRNSLINAERSSSQIIPSVIIDGNESKNNAISVSEDTPIIRFTK